MHPDVITSLEGSLVHHGSASDRAYLLKLGGAPETVAEELETLAAENGYSKIIAKVPAAVRADFASAGYRSEAAVPRFFRGHEEVHFMAKYLCPKRRQASRAETVAEVLATARGKAAATVDPAELDDRYAWRLCRPEDAEAMAEVYRRVFATYPFPIHNPPYLRQTMADNVVYFGIWEGERLVALSSAEMDVAASNVEMTDFATLPGCRGGGFAAFLLRQMEAEMTRRGIRTAYTIARAVSHGMNITFARGGYRYGGTLVNNTQISGSLESMNVWHKPLDNLVGCS